MGKFIIRRMFIVSIGCLIFSWAFAQSITDIQTPKVIPPSPDAAALGKYGQMPVDISTGVPRISIPLYEIKTPRFSLPVSLSYHASGIKVDERASWVGLGWALNAGGVITRTVVGLPDDDGLGYLQLPVTQASAIQWPQDSVLLQYVASGNEDSQPDNFFFNFNGQTGSFAFGPNKQPVLTPYRPLKIGFDTATGFHIIDEQGNHYSFNSTETVESSANTSTNLFAPISSWYLTQMISADLSDTIQFLYSKDSVAVNDFTHNFTQNVGPKLVDAGDGGDGTISDNDFLWDMVATQTETTYQPVRISSIVFKGGKLDFIPKGGRLDNANFSLDSVIISDYNGAIGQYSRLKSFTLLTGYSYSPVANPAPYLNPADTIDRYRLILNGLTENDGTNTVVKTHHFDYNQTALPPVHNFGQDMWGYYNGQYTNPTLLQSQQVLSNDGLESVFTIGNGIYGANRAVNPTYAQAGMLQRITYPTGGFTVFNYESNLQDTTLEISGGSEASAIGFYQNTDTVLYRPTTANLNSGGNIFHIYIKQTSGVPDTLDMPFTPFVQIIDSAAGSILYQLSANSLSDIDLDQGFSLTVGHTYELIAYAKVFGANLTTSTTLLPQSSIGTTYLVPSSGLTPVGGVRIASIQDYNSDSTLANTETYKYGVNESGGGDLLSAPFMTNVITRIFNWVTSECPNLFCSGAPVQVYNSGPVYPLSTISANPVAYREVSVYQGNTSQNTGKTEYDYFTYPDSMMLCSASYNGGFKFIPVTWKNGDPIREAQYRNTGLQYVVEHEKLTSFNLIEKPAARGLIIAYTFETPGVAQIAYNPTSLGNFTYFDYPISSGTRVPGQTVVNEYDSTGTTVLLTDTTNYFYDDSTLFLPTRTLAKDSKGHSIDTRTYRPLDTLAIDSVTPVSSTALVAIDSMISRNIISPVIQQVQYRNGQLTQLALTDYKIWSTNVIAPQTVQAKVGSNALDTRVQFNAYDARGNVLEVQKANDVDQVYLWGYNGQYPVAKILNTTYSVASSYINQSVLDNPSSDGVLRSQLNNLRSIPHAQVMAYTYEPLVGMTSQTDVQSRPSYYEYDALQRLKRVRDQDSNILKTFDYQYLAPGGCGTGCSILALQTFLGTTTPGYPVGIFDIHGNLVGNATGAANYVSLWNSDTADSRIGTLAVGADSLHFKLSINSGQTAPASVTGCRYYQYDLPWNKLDGITWNNGTYVNFGDGAAMHLPQTDSIGDTLYVLAPNTTREGFFNQFTGIYWFIHTYPDTSLKTITLYHNEVAFYTGLDNSTDPATSLTKVQNLRGNFPQGIQEIGGSCYQQPSALTVANVANWNTISSVTGFWAHCGDHVTPSLNLNYSQDFMGNNRNLRIINTTNLYYYQSGYWDSAFKLTRLKSDWNTYFTNLQDVEICDAHWNREDLSGLTHLSTFCLLPDNQNHSNNSTSNPNIPIPASVLDNVINQISAGAGQNVSNGVIWMLTGGSGRTAASDAAVAALDAKGWQIFLDNVQQ